MALEWFVLVTLAQAAPPTLTPVVPNYPVPPPARRNLPVSGQFSNSFTVEIDGSVTDCELRPLTLGGIALGPPILNVCPPRFAGPYLDSAGKPVRKRVTTISTVVTEDEP
jgi:hypothetical protein